MNGPTVLKATREATAAALLAWVSTLGLAACESPDQSRDERRPESSRSAENAAATEPTEAAGFAWPSPVEVASGGAEAGPWRMNDSRFHYVDDPSVEMHGGGTDVVWVDNRRQQVEFRRYVQTEEGQLEAARDQPTTVSRSPDIFSWLPRIETAGPEDRRVYVLWQEIVFSGGSHGGEAFFARSTDGGESFEEPKNLSQTQMGIGKGRLTEEIWHNGSLDIAVGHDGNIYTAWTAYQGPLEFRRSTDGGESFAETITVAGTDDAPARAPSLAVGPAGTLWLAWTVGESDTADLRIAISMDEGNSFSDPTTILPSDGHSDAPKLAATKDHLHLVYGESPDGMFERYHIRYGRSVIPEDPATVPSLEQSRRISASPDAKNAPDSAHFPSIALTDDDDVIAIWNQYSDHDDPPRGLRIAISRNEGDAFSNPVDIPHTDDDTLGINGSLQGMLMEKLDTADGRLGMVNSRFDEDVGSTVRLFPAEKPSK